MVADGRDQPLEVDVVHVTGRFVRRLAPRKRRQLEKHIVAALFASHRRDVGEATRLVRRGEADGTWVVGPVVCHREGGRAEAIAQSRDDIRDRRVLRGHSV